MSRYALVPASPPRPRRPQPLATPPPPIKTLRGRKIVIEKTPYRQIYSSHFGPQSTPQRPPCGPIVPINGPNYIRRVYKSAQGIMGLTPSSHWQRDPHKKKGNINMIRGRVTLPFMHPATPSNLTMVNVVAYVGTGDGRGSISEVGCFLQRERKGVV